MKDSLDALLEALCKSAEMPAQALLYCLSNLEAEDAERIREVWPHRPVTLRRRLSTRLVELAEADFTLDFGAFFRLGLEDVDAEVRQISIEGLWEDQDVRLVPRLATILQEDKAVGVRAAAATSLGRFVLLGELEKIRPKPRAAAYQALLAACQALDEHVEVQRRAMESLAYIGDEVVVETIGTAFAASEEKLRISAIFSMGRSADTRWNEHVQQELFSPNPEMRYEAALACGKLQLSEAVPKLEELVEDVDSEVQEAVLWALGQIGGDKARAILMHYCGAENEATRAAAEAALEELEFLHGDLSELFAELIGESNDE
jgi:HEAT repeat protein